VFDAEKDGGARGVVPRHQQQLHARALNVALNVARS
jgi:hypothetical protein